MFTKLDSSMTEEKQRIPLTLQLDIAPKPGETEPAGRNKIEFQDYSLFYGKFKAVGNISMQIPANQITAIIGPSGCGKSTLLRSINRMNDLVPNPHPEGQILLNGEDITASGVDVVDIRRRVGMVFQRPNPFPKSIYENVAYGPRLYGINHRYGLDEIVHNALKQAALWDEVKDKLNQSALALS